MKIPSMPSIDFTSTFRLDKKNDLQKNMQLFGKTGLLALGSLAIVSASTTSIPVVKVDLMQGDFFFVDANNTPASFAPKADWKNVKLTMVVGEWKGPIRCTFSIDTPLGQHPRGPISARFEQNGEQRQPGGLSRAGAFTMVKCGPE